MSDLAFGVFDVTAIVDDENPLPTAAGYEDHIRDAQLAERSAAAIRAQRDRVGYDVLLLNHQFVDMPRDLYVKSMQLFGERVIPAFRG